MKKQKEENRQVTITVKTELYSALDKMAAAMNAVGWCGADNSVATIIEEFCGIGDMDAEDIQANILNAIDTGSVGEEDARRREELNGEFAII